MFYPPASDITITQYNDKVQNDVIKTLSPENVCRNTFICKWSYKENSEQRVHKQVFTNESKSDSDIFSTLFEPVQIISLNY